MAKGRGSSSGAGTKKTASQPDPQPQVRQKQGQQVLASSSEAAREAEELVQRCLEAWEQDKVQSQDGSGEIGKGEMEL
jgi:hypothetical protein